MSKRDIFYFTKRKIISISIAIVFLCLLIFAFITQTLYSSRVFSNIDKQLMDQRNMFMSMPSWVVEDSNRPFVNERFFRNPPPMRPNLIVAVFEEDTIKGISPNLYFDEEEMSVILTTEDDVIKNVQYKEYNFRRISFNKDKYTIMLLANVDVEMDSVNKLRNTIIMSLIALILVAFILSAFLASRVIKPVKEAYDKQVYFVQDSSHEMRTPLAVIKGKLEILANSWGETIDDNFENISKVMSEVRGLEKLNNDLLLLTKEDIDVQANTAKVKLSKFIEDISSFYVDLAEMQDKDFQVVKPDSDVTLLWDYDKMKRIVVILLENAFKYTHTKGKIIISFEEANKHIKISVSDTGIGIKEEEQVRIFDRFFRSSDVRAQNISGSGIGLSLLRSISKALGITIKFTSVYGEGTEFNIMVPKIMK
jgi:two-component system, OmpR family, sensor histidine kinase CiaH